MITATARSLDLKKRYAAYIRNSIVAAIVIHALLFYFFPKFEFRPYTLSDSAEFELVVPDIIDVPPPPREVAQPRPDIVPSDDGVPVDDVDIAPNVFVGFDEVPPLAGPLIETSPVFHVFDEAPQLLTYVKPAYPELAMSAGIEGTVLLRVLVGEDGKVLSVDVLRSDVTPAMEAAAMTAARRFRFRPAKQGTIPVKAHMAVPVEFRLR